MCEYLDEGCDVWVETPRRARKPHRCTVCRTPIEAGVRYVEVTARGDYWWRARAHHACRTFTEGWQLGVCKQELWTIEPQDTPHQAVLEHMMDGDIGAAQAIGKWRDWMRARHREDVEVTP